MYKLIDDEGSEIVRERIERNGIRVQFNTTALENMGKDKVVGSDWRMERTYLTFSCSARVRPNKDIVQATEIQVLRGIRVDSRMRTNIPTSMPPATLPMPLTSSSGAGATMPSGRTHPKRDA